MGEVAGYHIIINEGSGFHELAAVSPSDSTLTVNYASFMYNITGEYLCFIAGASETGNPYGVAGETSSVSVCTEIIENITVPNAFTPNDDLVNDFFKPFLSFTPIDYYLIITDRKNTTLFESHDWMEVWDGKKKGESLAQGVYLWYLNVKTASGKLIKRSGTVTIIK
jgi:gliding motility-associated-like protein